MVNHQHFFFLAICLGWVSVDWHGVGMYLYATPEGVCHDRQVSCNDWCLIKELSSAYLLEKLVTPLHKLDLASDFPADGADTWISSCYLTREPCEKKNESDWVRPWQDDFRPCDNATPPVVRLFPLAIEEIL